jgi:hypothetical protein
MIRLKILITDSKLFEHPDLAPQLDKLRAAGHEVVIDDSLSSYDFITGPNCWLLRPEVAGLFTLAVTNARRIANADQERAKQSTVKKVVTRKPRAASTVSTRTRKNKTVTPTEQGGFFDSHTNTVTDTTSASADSQ